MDGLPVDELLESIAERHGRPPTPKQSISRQLRALGGMICVGIPNEVRCENCWWRWSYKDGAIKGKCPRCCHSPFSRPKPNPLAHLIPYARRGNVTPVVMRRLVTAGLVAYTPIEFRSTRWCAKTIRYILGHPEPGQNKAMRSMGMGRALRWMISQGCFFITDPGKRLEMAAGGKGFLHVDLRPGDKGYRCSLRGSVRTKRLIFFTRSASL